MNDN